MKGFILSKTTITLLLTLILLGAFTPAILGAVDELIKRSLFIHAEQITGLINIAQSSPSGTSHKYILQKGECTVNITKVSVNLTSGKKTTIKEIISHVGVADSEIKCNRDEDKAFYIKRCGDKVFVDEKSRWC